MILHQVEVYRGMSKENGRLARGASTQFEDSMVVNENTPTIPCRVTFWSFQKGLLLHCHTRFPVAPPLQLHTNNDKVLNLRACTVIRHRIPIPFRSLQMLVGYIS